MKFTNPIIPGFYPDPSVCRVGEDYYLVNSSFDYFPGLPIFHSRDLVHWEQIGHCLTRRSQLDLTLCWNSCGIFAPTIRHWRGMFYLVTTQTAGKGNFLVTATDPAGAWSDPIWIDQQGIDPSLFFEEDGSVYLQSSDGHRILQSQIDIATGQRLTEVREIWRGIGCTGPEGPHIYRINGWYYLMIAEGGTEYGHMENIARSREIWGPYESCPRNPILSHRSRSSPIQATGHGDLVQDPLGQWWMVFLGVRPVVYPPAYLLGRETFLTPVTWDSSGWPVVGNGGSVDLEMDAPLPPAHPLPAEALFDDFDSPVLAPYWAFIQNPAEENWSLQKRKSSLSLKCVKQDLNNHFWGDRLSQNFIGRRQRHLTCRAEVRLHFDPAHDGEEAGLTNFLNLHHHYEIALSRVGGANQILLRRRIGSLQAVVGQIPWGTGDVILGVECDKTNYAYYAKSPGGEAIALGKGETRYLTTESGGAFTGIFIGMYATGSGVGRDTWAHFDWMDYVVL